MARARPKLRPPSTQVTGRPGGCHGNPPPPAWPHATPVPAIVAMVTARFQEIISPRLGESARFFRVGSRPVPRQDAGKREKRILVITAAAGRGRAWEEKMYWNSFQTSQSKGKKKERDKKEKKKNIWVEGGDGMANERFQSRVPSPSSFSLSLWAPKKPRKINE